jgi:hypothetical protein
MFVGFRPVVILREGVLVSRVELSAQAMTLKKTRDDIISYKKKKLASALPPVQRWLV